MCQNKNQLPFYQPECCKEVQKHKLMYTRLTSLNVVFFAML